MGLFDFFKRKKAKKAPPPEREDISSFPDDDFLRVYSINFFGPCSKSPDGQYIVAWQDRDYRSGSGGGLRESGPGRFVLIRDNKLLFQRDLQRPDEARVSNNGHVVINDVMFGDTLRGTFYVFGENGAELIKHYMQANPLDCGISEDGDVAWCTSVYSDSQEDSDKLFVFATSPPKLLFKVDERDSLENIHIADEEIQITLRGAVRRYSYDGRLLNAEEIREAERVYTIEHGRGYDLIHLADQILAEKDPRELSGDELQEALSLLTKALQRDISDWHKAKVHRRLGELAEAQGDQSKP
jgi:hypothetical protein